MNAASALSRRPIASTCAVLAASASLPARSAASPAVRSALSASAKAACRAASSACFAARAASSTFHSRNCSGIADSACSYFARAIPSSWLTRSSASRAVSRGSSASTAFFTISSSRRSAASQVNFRTERRDRAFDGGNVSAQHGRRMRRLRQLVQAGLPRHQNALGPRKLACGLLPIVLRLFPGVLRVTERLVEPDVLDLAGRRRRVIARPAYRAGFARMKLRCQMKCLDLGEIRLRRLKTRFRLLGR